MLGCLGSRTPRVASRTDRAHVLTKMVASVSGSPLSVSTNSFSPETGVSTGVCTGSPVSNGSGCSAGEFVLPPTTPVSYEDPVNTPRVSTRLASGPTRLSLSLRLDLWIRDLGSFPPRAHEGFQSITFLPLDLVPIRAPTRRRPPRVSLRSRNLRPRCPDRTDEPLPVTTRPTSVPSRLLSHPQPDRSLPRLPPPLTSFRLRTSVCPPYLPSLSQSGLETGRRTNLSDGT